VSKETKRLDAMTTMSTYFERWTNEERERRMPMRCIVMFSIDKLLRRRPTYTCSMGCCQLCSVRNIHRMARVKHPLGYERWLESNGDVVDWGNPVADKTNIVN
jgi:hypothetical protein